MTERKRNRRLILKYPTSNDSTTGRSTSLNISSLSKARNPVMFPSSPSIFRRHLAELHTSFSISMVHTFLNFLRFCLAIPLKNSCKFQIFQIFHFLLGESQVLGEIEKTSPRPSPQTGGAGGPLFVAAALGRPKNTGRRCRDLLNPYGSW